jgi:hypothetical protein
MGAAAASPRTRASATRDGAGLVRRWRGGRGVKFLVSRYAKLGTRVSTYGAGLRCGPDVTASAGDWIYLDRAE